ncbi:hypothetical protein Ciccas_013720, partial [Cichlidogyrus casuarinus]
FGESAVERGVVQQTVKKKEKEERRGVIHAPVIKAALKETKQILILKLLRFAFPTAASDYTSFRAASMLFELLLSIMPALHASDIGHTNKQTHTHTCIPVAALLVFFI